MINREVSYERDVNKSYMKIPALLEDNFDETIIMKKQIAGLIPVEKCYVNGGGQYWYNISGKQALDAYCRINEIDMHFLENLILRLCEQLEILEWNLVDTNCLVIDPELIFINHSGEELSFVVYPYNKGDLFLEMQQLMEYLLTKLDHQDKMAVSAAYQLYELTLVEGLSIEELKSHILASRMDKTVIEQVPVNKNEFLNKNEFVDKKGSLDEKELMIEKPLKGGQKVTLEEKIASFLDEKLTWFYEKVGTVLEKTPLEIHKELRMKKEKNLEIVYPEDIEAEEENIQIHPTVCISKGFGAARGVLVCESRGECPDFEIKKETAIIGKNPKVRFCIPRDTISQFHARIEYQENKYYIEDLNSTNGTYVNDIPLNYKQRYCLSVGDSLRFADVRFHFY